MATDHFKNVHLAAGNKGTSRLTAKDEIGSHFSWSS